jgi:MFS family permease
LPPALARLHDDDEDPLNIHLVHDPYAALRHRDYCFLLSSNVLAATAAEMQFAAVEWELFQRTGLPEYLGYGGLAQFLPVLLLGLPAGQAADHFNRKYLLMAAHAAMMLASLGLALVSFTGGPVWMIFVFLALAGCARALGMPTRSSLIPLVVPVEAVGNAVTWTSSGWQVARVAGSSLGGLLVAITGSPGDVYWLTAAGLVVCIGLVAGIRLRSAESPAEPRSLQSLLAGIRFVWNTQVLLAAITLDLFAVLLGGATALLPMFAEKILEVGPIGFGWLRAAEAIGAFGMAMVLAHRAPLQRPGLALLWSVAGFGIAIIVFGLSEHFALSFVALLLMGALDNISVVIRGTLMQVLTPDAMRGRVAAVNSIFISSTNQLGAFESGITASWWGPVAAVVVGGAGTLLVVALAAIASPKLRQLEPLHTLKNDGEP